MASKHTGFHPADADWTKGRSQAVADAEATVRRQAGLARPVTFVHANCTAPASAVPLPEMTRPYRSTG